MNISTRAPVGTDSNVLIGGFVISGTEPKSVLIRAVGPGLGAFGVPGTLADPQLQLFDKDGKVLQTNDNWDASTADTASRLGAFGIATGSKDAVLLTTLAPGSYTAQVSGLGTTKTGIAIVEIYEADSKGRLANLSSRMQVGIGPMNAGVAGFVVGEGSGSRRLLIRGIGPALAAFGQPGCLADPRLQLFDGSQKLITEVVANGNAAPLAKAADACGAFGLTANDTAIIVTATPGSYTANISGNSGSTTGLAMIEVYDITDAAGLPDNYSTATATAPDFGPNVFVFDPTMSAASIQARADAVFSQQEYNQFGSSHYAMLFRPGVYDTTVKVGFYTQVLGLGSTPDDVTITGTVSSDARWFNGNATCNFWRSAENLLVVPTGGSERWAVSQASPFRRMHVKGNMQLDDGGWSSGGFISDSVVDGTIYSGSQQQWLTRSSDLGGWIGGSWNMVFVGVNGAPAGIFPANPIVVVDKPHYTREKPSLLIDGDGAYRVFVPALAKAVKGATWNHGTQAGTSIPLSQFYIAKENSDNADTMNAALAAGKNLLITPGVYHLQSPLHVTRAGTVILGIGIPVLTAEGGSVAIKVDDLDGVVLAGMLIDAGATTSPVLVEIGATTSSVDHSANPVSLHDLFFRVGGAAVGKADVSLRVNSNDVIGDNLWVWRGDHSYGVGWTTNTTVNGAVINGARVTMYGLFVEHYHQYQTLWNGEDGRTYFYQSEAPYDVPDQASWTHGGINGYASYKVADTVRTHEAWGLGVYCFFNTNKAVKLGSGIEAPTAAGVRLHAMTSVSLGGVGEITHVINGLGSTANSSLNNCTVAEFSNP
jgi:hypothetical protein